MLAHQIIYTSCRRGIEGRSDGLQVFSYDEGLARAGWDVGVGYRNLLPFEVPDRAGETVFGYVPVEGCGAVWACNTKLAHDYRGAAGRSGNVLRHAVAAPLGEVEEEGFRPVEAAGAPIWRRSMPYDEVNSAEPPAYLDPVELAPSEGFGFAATCRWVARNGAADLAAALALTAVRAAAEGRSVAILAEAGEALRWVAAATFGLPVGLALKLSFAVGCTNLAAGGAVLCGISPDAFYGSTPAFARDACYVLDPKARTLVDRACCGRGAASGPAAEGADGGEEPGARFERFVARAWREDPDNLASFCARCDRDLTLDLDPADLDGAVTVHLLAEDGFPARREADAAADAEAAQALRFAERRGSCALNRELSNAALASLHEVGNGLGVEALGYLLRYLRKAPMSERALVAESLSDLMKIPGYSQFFLEALVSLAPDTVSPRTIAPAAGDQDHGARRDGAPSRPRLPRIGFPFGRGRGNR